MTHEELAQFDYLPCSEIPDLMISNVNVPDQLGLCLSGLEKEVIQSSGVSACMRVALTG